MAKYNPDFLVVLSGQITDYALLKALDEKYALTLFSCFNPGVITAVDSEVNANPQLLNEAVSLLETAVQLSAFYTVEGETSFIDTMINAIVAMRLTWKKKANFTPSYKETNASLQQEMMNEYFVTSEEEFSLFLNSNPVYLGIYLYVYVRTVAML